MLVVGGLVVAAITAAIFAPVGGFDFINYDDTEHVTENPWVRAGVTREGLSWAFSNRFFGWYPLAFLSHMLDCQFLGPDASGAHHRVNAAIHTLNALLVFALAWRVSRSVALAALGTLLFSLHPLRVEAVAWVTSRKELLAGFFGLLAVHAYLSYGVRRSAGWYLATVLAMALAALSHARVAPLPVALFLLDAWPLRRWGDGVWGGEARGGEAGPRWPTLRMVLEKLPLLAIVGVSVFMASRSLALSVDIASAPRLPWPTRLLNMGPSLASQLELSFWPSGLAPIYHHPGRYAAATLAWSWAAVLIPLALGVAVFRRSPGVLVGLAWFVLMLLPTTGLVYFGFPVPHADRFTYLPSLGLVLAVLAVGAALPRAGAVAVASLLGLALLPLAWATHGQLALWKDSVTLLSHTVRAQPSVQRARALLADAHWRRGDVQAARLAAVEAVGAHADNAAALRILAKTELALGEVAGAARVLSEGLKLQPSDVGLLSDMGELQLRLGRPENLAAAAELFDRAVRLQPQPIARRNLGYALLRLGRHAEAATQFELASRGDPSDGRARLLWGKALRAQGRFSEASPLTTAGIELLLPQLEALRRGLEAGSPDDPRRRERENERATLERQVGEAYFELGGDAARRRDWRSAQAQLAEASRLLPQSAQVRAALEHARSQTQGPKSP